MCPSGFVNQDTFWSMLRIARGVTLQTIAKDTGIGLGALTTYFSGEHIPREFALMTLCNYFDVDLDLGREKFNEGHEIWNNRHSPEWHTHDRQRESEYHKKYNRTNAIPICISFDRKKDRDLLDKLDTIELGNRSPYIKWLMRQHLGNDAFSTERLTQEVRDVLSVIYSEVPFDIFMKCLETLLDTKMFDVKLLYGYVTYKTYMKIYKMQDNI